MWRDKQNLYCDIKPLHCSCGAVARVRYRMPLTWVECKRKCGIHTGYYRDTDDPNDFEPVRKAVIEWNRMVSKNADITKS